MNFEMTGKLSLPKETDKFKPYQEKKFESSGWVRKQLMFNVSCGDNRHMLSVTAGAFEDGHGDVYTFTKSSVGENGEKVKGESLKIPFKERLTSPKLDEVAEYKKFIFDLEEPGRRFKLEKAAEKLKEGMSFSDEDLEELGVTDVDSINEELEKSKKRRHEFISEWDYVDYILKVLKSDKYKNRKFHIRGNGEYQYSDTNQKFYESYIPNRIYLAANDAEEYSNATIKLLFNSESFDDASVEEKGKYYVSGYMMEYDSNRKSLVPVPTMIVIPEAPEDADEKTKKKVNAIKHKFMVEDGDETFYEYGMVVDMLNGAQKQQITEDMLSDEQKEDLECGLITMEDIEKEVGNGVYGERVREYRFIKPANGFTKGRKETAYVEENMVVKPIEVLEEDLFDDDDDEL